MTNKQLIAEALSFKPMGTRADWGTVLERKGARYVVLYHGLHVPYPQWSFRIEGDALIDDPQLTADEFIIDPTAYETKLRRAIQTLSDAFSRAEPRPLELRAAVEFLDREVHAWGEGAIFRDINPMTMALAIVVLARVVCGEMKMGKGGKIEQAMTRA